MKKNFTLTRSLHNWIKDSTIGKTKEVKLKES